MKCKNCSKKIASEQPRIIRGKEYAHMHLEDCENTVSGTRLSSLRKRKGISVSALAEKSELSRTYIYKLERGAITKDRFSSLQEIIKGLAPKKDYKTSLRPEVVKEGSALKARRLAAGIKRVDMAKQMGMKYAAYEAYERGMSKMSKEFKTKINKILKKEEPPADFSPVVCISKTELDKLRESHNNWLALKKILAQ